MSKSESTEERIVRAAREKFRSEAAQRQRQEIAETTGEWVYVSEACAFVRRSDRRVWSDRQFGGHFAHLHPKGSITNHILRTPGLISKFETLVYEPGEPEELDSSYNLWRAGGVESAPGDATWFTDHIAYLFPEGEAADLVLDFLALLVRQPFTKIIFALLIWSKSQGIGKSALAQIVLQMIGEHNAVFPSNKELGDRYTTWLEGSQLVVIEELMMLGRREVANALKPIITEPNLRIRAMYRADYAIPNRVNLMAFSNHSDALPVEKDDRRWLIIESRAEPRGKDYYARLWSHIDNDASVAAVKHFLETREVRLNPKARAPATTSKADMIEQSRADAEAIALEKFQEGAWPFDCDLVKLEDVVSMVQRRVRGERNLVARMRALLRDELNAVQHARYQKPGATNAALWSVRNHDKWAKASALDRARAYEAFENTRYTRQFGRVDDD